MTADLFSSQCKLNKITHHMGLAEISLLTKFGQKKIMQHSTGWVSLAQNSAFRWRNVLAFILCPVSPLQVPCLIKQKGLRGRSNQWEPQQAFQSLPDNYISLPFGKQYSYLQLVKFGTISLPLLEEVYHVLTNGQLLFPLASSQCKSQLNIVV